MKVIDLFCGCGGLSEGFRLAGYEIIGGVDFNEPAIKTYNKNFEGAKGICCDLLSMDKNKIIEAFGNLENIDVIIGGPPCQGFSSANRYKIEGEDPRNKLFFEFVKFVDLAKPRAIVIENVKGIVTSNNGYAKNRIYEIFESRGYAVNHMILNAADYGVPQKRQRNFFVMLKGNEKFDFASMRKHGKVIDVFEAIGELYNYEDHTTNENFVLESDAITEYQKYLREPDNVVSNHEVRYPAEKVQERISHVPQGGNWADVPAELWPSNRNNRHSSAYKRLKETDPSCTIDTGNNHSNYFHPLYNRIPTVREAARLQSFRDGFVFMGNRSEQYRQVGNAVPPLLSKAIAVRLKEILEGKENNGKIIDLFCGCGGLSFGFEKAGFDIALAIDMWKDAVATYNHNHKKPVAKCIDIHTLTAEYLQETAADGKIVGIIGGPPCQGYSTVGTRDINDPRNHLYKEYCRVVETVRPDFFVIENVKGLTTLSGGAFRDDIIDRFGKLGYKVTYQIVNAADYGVPQNRHRVFFVGLKDKEFVFPDVLTEKLTTKDAISDLPYINNDNGLEKEFRYTMPPKNEYQRMMRANSKNVKNHQITVHSEQTVNIISMIPDGGKIKDLPEEYWNIRKYNKAFERMSSTRPSNTVDTGHRNYFHYEENRIPTVRENARLQSFPDNFEFLGTKTSQYKQVGNAVPPLLAYAIAKAIKRQL